AGRTRRPSPPPAARAGSWAASWPTAAAPPASPTRSVRSSARPPRRCASTNRGWTAAPRSTPPGTPRSAAVPRSSRPRRVPPPSPRYRSSPGRRLVGGVEQQPVHAGLAEEREAPAQVRRRGRRIGEGPEVGADAATLVEQVAQPPGVLHGRLDLRPVADDPGVALDPLD